MEVDYKAIGQRIKIARIKKGVTQETVADLIDITPAHMSNVETGKTKVSLPTLIAIANALSVSVDTLLCDNVIASKIIFEKEAKDIALALELFTKGNLNTFAKPTNVQTQNRLVCYDIIDLGEQLTPIGMLVILDNILNRITRNRKSGNGSG